MKTVKENARKERKNPNEIAIVQPTDKKKKKKKTLHRVSKRKKLKRRRATWNESYEDDD